jgi:hypothetical protein
VKNVFHLNFELIKIVNLHILELSVDKIQDLSLARNYTQRHFKKKKKKINTDIFSLLSSLAHKYIAHLHCVSLIAN